MFHGSLVALITPMNENGAINFESLAKLVNFHLENGTDGIVVAGTTGESATLTHKEKLQLIEYVVDQVNERVPVIAGTGLTSTQASIELTTAAMELGVDGCLLMAPSTVKPTQEGLYLHYRTIAQAVPVPLIMYNIPGRTACDILPETLDRLADLPNIIGLKEASGSLERAKEVMELCSGRLDIYSGEDALAKDLILAGGRGVISVTANIAPKMMNLMCEAALAGDVDLANELDSKLQALHKAMFIESNPIPVKWAAHHLGLVPAGIRLPLTELNPDKRKLIDEAMDSAGILGV